MSTFRKLLIWVISTLLTFCLTMLVLTVCLNQVFGNPAYLKQTIRRSGIYEHFIDDVLTESRRVSEPQENGVIPLEREEIRRAAREAFSPMFLEQSVGTIIDGVYAWLNGKTDQPIFQVDFGPAKTDFARQVSSYARERLASLPPCRSGEIPPALDVFTATCLPPGFNAEPELERISRELATTTDYLSNPVLSAETLKTRENGQEVSVFDQLDKLPRIFKVMRIAPFVFGFLALLSAMSIIGFNATRTNGTKRVSSILILNGLLIVVGYLLLNFAAGRFTRELTQNGVEPATALEDSFTRSALASFQNTVGRTLIFFGCLYIVSGVVIRIMLWVIKRRAETDIPTPPQLNPSPPGSPTTP